MLSYFISVSDLWLGVPSMKAMVKSVPHTMLIISKLPHKGSVKHINST